MTRTDATDTVPEKVEVDSQVNTVPVGLVMNVTPQINVSDMVTLNVRPTITRIREFISDPGVAIAAASFGVAVESRVPVVQVRETETVMRVGSGQIAVLGGLMQDRQSRDRDGVPGLSDLDGIGGVFENRDYNSVKTELVIFLKPTVIRAPSVEGDLKAFRQFLPENLESFAPLPTPIESF